MWTKKSLKYGESERTIQPWIEKHESVQNYLQHLNARKARAALMVYVYCQWASSVTLDKVKTPEDLLALKNISGNSDAEKLLDKFTRSQTNIPDSVKFSVVNCVKAFYRYNYNDLQSAAGKFEYSTKKSRQVTSKETCEKLFRACYNPRDKALIMLSTCTAIAIESMSQLRWDHFEIDWQNQEIPCITLPGEILKGHNKGRYRGVQQITFLTPEAKTILLEYRKYYEETFKHTWKPDEHVFLSVKRNLHRAQSRTVISRIIYHLSLRAGVKFGIHDGRARVQTALENVGVSINWVRKAKGRKVKSEESPYSKPAIEQLRQKYREALPDLEFLSNAHQKVATPQEKFASNFASILEQHPDVMNKFEKFLLAL
jgi:hypothetical protein